jgi:hypothetical protein
MSTRKQAPDGEDTPMDAAQLVSAALRALGAVQPGTAAHTARYYLEQAREALSK